MTNIFTLDIALGAKWAKIETNSSPHNGAVVAIVKMKKKQKKGRQE